MTKSHRLPCGCRGRQGDDGLLVIHAEGFACTSRHREGERLTVAAVVELAVDAAVEDAMGFRACGNCGADAQENVYWNLTGGWTCTACGQSDLPEAAE